MKPLRSREYPDTHLMNPEKRYVPAANTDIRATFERIRAEQKEQPKKEKVRRIK